MLVRNALFLRVRLASKDDVETLGELDAEWGFGPRAWRQALDAFNDEHDELLLDADARSNAYFVVDDADEKADHVWHVRQIFHDGDFANDFAIVADVDLDATQQGDGVVFSKYRAGFVDEIDG